MWKLTVLLVMLLSGLCSAVADASSTVKATVHFTGATKLSAVDRRQIADEVERQVREHISSGTLDSRVADIVERVRIALQKRGYFKAELGTPNVSVRRKGAEVQAIDVTIDVHEGYQYRLQEITFTGASTFRSPELRGQFPLSSGDIFDTDKIRAGLKNLRKLYDAHGYRNFTPVPDTKINDDAQSILLQIDIIEGQVFHFGKLIVRGVESIPGARDRLLAAWRPYEGNVFDGQIPRGFLHEIGFALGVNPKEVFEFDSDGRHAIVNLSITLARLP